MAWAFRIIPQPGELLSSYLCRAAAAHGASPYSFCRTHLEDAAFWARDVDRGVARRHENNFRDLAQVDQEAVRQMTLSAWAAALTPSGYRSAGVAAVIPWINAAGVFHRTRRLHALQYCPECLSERGCFARYWRLSFVVACDRHRRLLLDSCPRCDAPIIPHRSHATGLRCHACSASLSHARRGEEPQEVAFVLQQALCARLEAATACEDDGARADLHGVRLLASSLLVAHRIERTMAALSIGDEKLPRRGHRLEVARLPIRLRALQVCGQVLQAWPSAFRSLVDRLSLRREDFSVPFPLASWLASEVDSLPCRRARTKFRAGSRVAQRLEDLRTRQPSNWRGLHAALMMRAAGSRP
ncbi:UNVERIFIED_ORG: hypothetical protein J2W38_006747 [Variovorax paradoxus]|nr:hypothetical protein [Variovorax paradoxus]